METSLTVQTERLDDIPLLLGHLDQMGIKSLLDRYFPCHGNWTGQSLGTIVCVWLSHILSESEHYLDHVRPWVLEKLHSLQSIVSPELNEFDFTDDRLGAILTRLSDANQWSRFESELGSHLLCVYDLESSCVRHDSTSSSSFRSLSSESESEGSLFHYGHSKDHRPDLPQLKVMLSALDPLGLPLATEVLPGNCADDPLYIPSVKRVQQTLQKKGLLHVGDTKISCLATRAFIVASGDAYLCPLSKKQFSEEQISHELDRAFATEKPLTKVFRQNAKGEQNLIAEGFEICRTLNTEVHGKEFHWQERLFLVRSFQHAQTAERGLLKRLQQAQTEIEALNQKGRGKRRPKTLKALEEKIEELLKKHRVHQLLHVDIQETFQHQRVRNYKDRPEEVRIHWDFQLKTRRNEILLQQQIQRLGWRPYATPLTQQQITLEEAVLCYRNEFRIEHNFKRIKGPLSLRPFQLKREDRIQGLIHLLTLALRVLTLMEFNVRKQLKENDKQLHGLYLGNPKRANSRPTAEKMLKAFKNIQLSIVELPQKKEIFLNPLSPLQQDILQLMRLPIDTYSRLVDHSLKPS